MTYTDTNTFTQADVLSSFKTWLANIYTNIGAGRKQEDYSSCVYTKRYDLSSYMNELLLPGVGAERTRGLRIFGLHSQD